jgi:hypothetical protein
MSLKTYFNITVAVAIFSGAAWILVISKIDPYEQGLSGLLFFYFTLFFLLTGLFSIIGFKLRQKILNNELLFGLVGISFRQGIWISILLVGLLLMQGSRILNWWDALLLAVSLFLLEAYFIAE